MVAIWPEKGTNNFAQYYFTSQRKLGTGFTVKIRQKSYACLRSRSDNQSNLHLVDQSLRNTRRVSRSPTKYLQSTTLFSKTSGSSTGSQKSELQAWYAHSREIAGIWRPLRAWMIHSDPWRKSLIFGSRLSQTCLVATPYRQQYGEQSFKEETESTFWWPSEHFQIVKSFSHLLNKLLKSSPLTANQTWNICLSFCFHSVKEQNYSICSLYHIIFL